MCLGMIQVCVGLLSVTEFDGPTLFGKFLVSHNVTGSIVILTLEVALLLLC